MVGLLLTRKYTTLISVYPSGSRAVTVKVCDKAVELVGVPETTEGRLEAAGVQVLVCTHPVSWPSLSFTQKYTPRLPLAYVPLSPNPMLTTRSVPDPETREDVLPLTEHWLFCTLPAVPGVTGPMTAVSASLYRYKAFVA